MAFALLIIGAVLLISATKGTTDGPEGLFALLVGDFSGPQNFIYWAVAILLIGAIGYIPKLKPFSVALLGLVVLVLFLTRGDPTKASGGFFEKFTAGLAVTTKPVTSAAAASATPSTGPVLSPPKPLNAPLNLLDLLPPISNVIM